MTLFEELDQVLQNLASVRGISPVDLLSLPDIIGHTLGAMVYKQGLTLAEFAAKVGVNEEEAHHLADILVDKGYLVEVSQGEARPVYFRVAFARMRSHHLPLDL